MRIKWASSLFSMINLRNWQAFILMVNSKCLKWCHQWEWTRCLQWCHLWQASIKLRIKIGCLHLKWRIQARFKAWSQVKWHNLKCNARKRTSRMLSTNSVSMIKAANLKSMIPRKSKKCLLWLKCLVNLVNGRCLKQTLNLFICQLRLCPAVDIRCLSLFKCHYQLNNTRCLSLFRFHCQLIICRTLSLCLRLCSQSPLQFSARA